MGIRATARVVIIGGGMAGLSAAQHLYANGFRSITLLEARRRLGGRIHSETLGGKNVVEMGANWILGPCSANPVFVLAKQNNLELGEFRAPSKKMDGLWVKPDGTPIGTNVVQRAVKEFMQIESQVTKATKSRGVNSVEFIKSAFKMAIQDMDCTDQKDALCALRSMVNFAQAFDGGCLERSRGKGEPFDRLPGGEMWLPGGIQSLLDPLAKDLPSRTVQLRSEVVSIDWSGPESRVMCKEGRVHKADHVIVTIPVGVLKQRKEKFFIPHLPAKKADAIDTIPMGKLNKILLRWEKPFWEPGMGSIKLCWSDDESRGWWRRIFGFQEIAPNALMAMVTGEEAEHLESLSDQEILENCGSLIRQFLRNPSIGSPNDVLVSRWCSDPYARGSFSYQGTDVTQEALEDLGAPLEKHRVMFAGEATVPWAYGTMHGARASGLREAQRIVDFY